MAIQTSSVATTGNLTKYEAQYTLGAEAMRTYDQLATPVGATIEKNGATVTRAFLQAPVPRPTTAVGNENADFEPQTIRDSSASLTKTYINDGIKAHDLAFLKSNLLTPEALSRATGELAMQTIDALARRAATEGNLALQGGSTLVTARTTLDLGTAGHRMGIDCFTNAQAYLASWMKDDGLFAILTPFQYSDLLSSASGAIVSASIYTDKGLDTLFNFEVGQLAKIRVIRSPFAKVFYGAGAANAAPVSTTIATSTTANKAGAKTIEVAANTNIAAGMWLTIGTVQSSTESDDTLITENVLVASISTTTITVTGMGAGGGLKYDHVVGATVKNSDSVHCAVFGTAQSLACDFDYGRNGKMVKPRPDGNAEQWQAWAFKYYGGYAILDQSSIMRIETSSSKQ